MQAPEQAEGSFDLEGMSQPMKLAGIRKSSLAAAVLTLAVSLGSIVAPLTRAEATPQTPGGQVQFILPIIPTTYHYWYLDAQGWGTLDAQVVGHNNQTGEDIISV